MPTEQRIFKRLVLGLQPNAPDRVMHLAVRLAELLDIELLGLFLEDTSLRDLAGIPFAREFRPFDFGWHAIEVDWLSRDIERAAHTIEKMFSEAAKNVVTRHQFEIVRGPLAVTVPSISRSGDIVMIIEPASAAERATQQFAWLIEAAFRSDAAVMIVPPRIAQTNGPVLAIAVGPDDPSIAAAGAIACVAKEELVIINVGETRIDDREIRTLAAATGCRVRLIAVRQSVRSNSSALDRALHQFRERLVVLTRGVLDDRRAAAIASVRNVPVLIVEPAGRSASQSGA